MPVILDHFKFYDVNRYQVGIEVSLQGQFDDAPLKAFLSQVVLLGPAVNKNHEGVYDPKRHLNAYEIFTDPEPPRRVQIRNQFGDQDLRIETPELLLTPSIFVDPTGPSPEVLDHFKCYRVTQGPTIRQDVFLEDHFDGGDATAIDGPAAYFCVPVEKRYGDLREPINMPNDHLTIYEIRPKDYPLLGGTIQDQFRSGQFYVVRSRYLAVPTVKLGWALD